MPGGRKSSRQIGPREPGERCARERLPLELDGICADLPTREGCARELEDERPTGAGDDQTRISCLIELQRQLCGRTRCRVVSNGGVTFWVT